MNPWRWVDPRILSVRVADLKAYFHRRGWRLRPNPNPNLLRFEEVPSGKSPAFFQIVPASEQAADYRQRIAELITTVSELEDRHPVEVLNDILGLVQGEQTMAGTWTSQRFPHFEQALGRLTEQHRALKDEPLHLAFSYGPDRDPQDIFLLEVIGGSAEEGPNPDRELFEATFAPAPGFPMNPDQRLHLVLTTPEEFQTALREDWPAAGEILSAIRSGDYKVLYADAVGQELLEYVQTEVGDKEGAVRG